MCGIVGYIGQKSAQDIVLEGLHSLEYRGYDSAGMAGIMDGQMHVVKEAGKLTALEEALKKHPLDTNMAIGHTRWATHGRPERANAHPHQSADGKIALVHNGIIENYEELRDRYLQGETFTSNTDSEIVAHVIAHFYQGDLLEAVRRTLKEVRGSYALAIISADEPDTMVICRMNSPLVLGVGDKEMLVASGVPALLKYTRECIYLENGDLAKLTTSGYDIVDLDGNPCQREMVHIDWEDQSAEKEGYDHYMMKEIHEQPETFRRVMTGRLHEDAVTFKEFTLTDEQIQNWQHIDIVACGTAYHSGLVGKSILEETLQLPVNVEVASEFRYRNPRLDAHSLVILISQSGETADTLEALREAKQRGATTIAITNVVGSAISREADQVLYLWAGPEISVASTKAYTAMLIALYLLAFYLGDRAGRFNLADHKDLLEALAKLPDQAESLLTEAKKEEIRQHSQALIDADHLFYIGRGSDWAVAQEGALKIKEISYIHAEAYAAGELKHGTLALVTDGTPFVAIALQEKTFEKTLSNVNEVVARKGRVLCLLKEGHDKISDDLDKRIFIPDCLDMVAPILAAIPLQLLAYYTAEARGCDIDQPRNLAKSVTVE
ncbi:glutamine--fructose-6-phosphate transaminase (isomerizing) [Peptococcus simiae]|uniref:Glutamine--fructose-6-phosphate aminotransferase [isomerizing] n=1 Tax=Peptococcus simiae TaxID=1643805 RepID=A0ABW9H3Z1_9FIRM